MADAQLLRPSDAASYVDEVGALERALAAREARIRELESMVGLDLDALREALAEKREECEKYRNEAACLQGVENELLSAQENIDLYKQELAAKIGDCARLTRELADSKSIQLGEKKILIEEIEAHTETKRLLAEARAALQATRETWVLAIDVMRECEPGDRVPFDQVHRPLEEIDAALAGKGETAWLRLGRMLDALQPAAKEDEG